MNPAIKFCDICKKVIVGEDYHYSKTKPRVFQTMGEKHRVPSKTIYFHINCYNELYHPNK